MATDLVLRPATPADAGPVWDLLVDAADDIVGMTSLPSNPSAADALCAETATTVTDLAAGWFELSEGGRRRLLFVAVDPTSDRVLGVTSCTFKAAVPNLAIWVETSRSGCGLVMRSSAEPWTRTELGSSYLSAEARGQGHGTLLSRGRLMLLHTVASQVPNTIVSHLRGVFEDGSAPFWQCFGRHFAPQWATSGEAEAAFESDVANLEEVTGRTRAIDATVLASLGAVHRASQPAFRLLLAEGLDPTGMFDPVDGGPTVVGQLSRLATRRQRRHGRVTIEPGLGSRDGTDALISSTTIESFRATRGRAQVPDGGGVIVDACTAERLGVSAGSVVAASSLGVP